MYALYSHAHTVSYTNMHCTLNSSELWTLLTLSNCLFSCIVERKEQKMPETTVITPETETKLKVKHNRVEQDTLVSGNGEHTVSQVLPVTSCEI